VYREQVNITRGGTEAKKITIRNYRNEVVEINGGNLRSSVSDWKSEGNNVWSTAKVPVNPCYILIGGAKGIRVEQMQELNADGKWHWKNNQIYVYSASNPSSRQIDIPERDYGINILGNYKSGNIVSYITITGLTVKNVLAHGFTCRFGTSDITFLNCSALYCGSYGRGYGNAFSIEHKSNRITVKDCLAEDNYDCGLSFETASSKDPANRISDCIVDNLTVRRTLRQYGILCWNNVHNITIKNCTISDTKSRGVFLHGENNPCTNISITNCKMYNVGKEGVYIRLNCKDVSIQDTLIEGAQLSGINIIMGASKIAVRNTRIVRPAGYGIQIGLKSSYLQVDKSVIDGGVLVGDGDYESYLASHVRIENSTINGQIYLRYASAVLLKNNNISNSGAELLAISPRSVKLGGHYINGNSYARLDSGTRFVVYGKKSGLDLKAFYHESGHERDGVSANKK
jgi:hypothetical protein